MEDTLTTRRFSITPSQGFLISGTLILLCILLFGMLGPLLSGFHYDDVHLALQNQPPSSRFWFGTDELGRDVFTRIAMGARISLSLGFCAALVDSCIGIVWGGVAAWAGGRWDRYLMGITNVLYALPSLLLAILLTLLGGSGFFSVLGALVVVGWIQMARIVRGQFLHLRQQSFVQAAVTIGASPFRIFFHYLLPNAIRPISICMTLTIPSAIFSEAFLSFLGLGIQVPTPSWGSMIQDALSTLSFYPWRLLFPSFFIGITLLAFYLISEGLEHAVSAE